MRLRYLIVLAVFGALAAASPSPAAPPARPVTGTMFGMGTTGVATFCTAGTISTTGSFDATFIGSGTYTGTVTTSSCLFPPFCCGVPSDPYPVDGTFTFSGRGGSFTASGTGTGVTFTSAHTDDYTFDLDLAIGGGTGRYRHATGSLSLELFADVLFLDETEGSSGTIDGSITIGGPPA
jgi:hypothetical protein